MNTIDFLSNVLQDYCTLHNLEYISADELLYESNNNEYYTWGEGDSLDRERVRDIILEQPQFTWSH